MRKELRPWINQPPVPVPAFPALPKTAKDRMRECRRDPYLENERALPALLDRERFAGGVRMDEHGNAVFPHKKRRLYRLCDGWNRIAGIKTWRAQLIAQVKSSF